jgi:8-oxo-dGTP pyrophosphatase MutT (NUDIX family)
VSKEERRRRRKEQRELEVQRAVDNLKFVEYFGLMPVVDKNGLFTAGVVEDGEIEAALRELNEKAGMVRGTCDNLYQMHKNERERKILLDAWERFQDEEY